MSRRPWPLADDRKLTRLYRDHSAAECAQAIGRTTSAVQQRVSVLGLSKSPEWVAERSRQKWAEGAYESNRKGMFQKGQEAWNKGKPQAEWLPAESRKRCARTQFRKGEMHGMAQHNWVPVGSQKIRDGQLVRKVTDDPEIYPAKRWQPVSRIVWEAAHGPIPDGYAVVFKPGARTTVEAEITLDRLECITRAELMRRNSYHTHLPPEVAQLVQLRGAITRKINRKARELER